MHAIMFIAAAICFLFGMFFIQFVRSDIQIGIVLTSFIGSTILAGLGVAIQRMEAILKTTQPTAAPEA